uniref:ShKT domain-containing protein n=1 Tax=Elaeophora elaphi TaxID=1147741 RepID=A0A0R3RXS1_9BILA
MNSNNFNRHRYGLIERNEIYPRSANNVTRTAKQRNTLLESFFARLKDDPILDEQADDSEESMKKVSDLKVKYRFGDYGSYKEMLKYMRTIEFYYPHITKLVRIGVSHEGAPIEGLKIGYPIRDVNKRAFWIDGNIHAREWASSHTALYFINQLVSGFGKDPIITRYLRSLNIYIFPCLNPDGYEYTRSKPNPQVRLWRKNRSPQKCIHSSWGGRRCCEGVDLNRNFDFHWAEIGSSENPCSYLYQGESAFSEPETRAVRDFLLSPEMRGKLDGFITLHTYAQLWIHPYSHKVESFPDNHAQLERTAKRAVSRLKKVYGTQYKIGTGANILAPASGGSDDWAKKALGVKFVYLLELRPQLESANKGTKTQQNDGISHILAGVKIAPDLSTFNSSVRSRSIDSTVYFRNGTITSTQSNPTNKIDNITEPINNRTDSLVINDVQPLRTIHSNHEAISNQLKLSNQTHQIASPVKLYSSPLAMHRLSNSSHRQFLNSSCRDIRKSCKLWLGANPNICIDQYQLMKVQCMRTCGYCTYLG